jgi:hypothetical protein
MIGMKLLHAPTSFGARMLFHEPTSVRVSKWAGELSKWTESFFKYYTHVDIIFEKYLLMPRTKYLVTSKNILPHVHGWTIFMDENVDRIWFNLKIYMEFNGA